MPINTDSYSLHLHQLVKLAVILLVSCASFSSSADTPNISDQYFEDIPNPLTLDWNIHKGYAAVTFEAVDVDQDGLKDVIIHFWKQHTGDEFNGTTPNFLKVFKLKFLL